MIEAVFRLRDLQYDEPELHIELYASNGLTSVTQDFYCDVEALSGFGAALAAFPESTSSEAKLEIGERHPSWAYYLLVRAYVHDGVGHSALQIDVESHAKDPYGGAARFHIRCEPAALNRLGKSIEAWCKDRREAFEWRTAG